MSPDEITEVDLDHLNDMQCLAQNLRFCFFYPIFLIPYFLRALRLIKIFTTHKTYVIKKMKEGISNFKKVESSYCIREGNLACWFIIVLIIFLCLFVFNIINEYFYEIFLPNFNYGQCLPPEDYMIEADQTVFGFLAL